MFTNDIKRGTEFQRANGWWARMEDNKKGNIRLATVFGTYTETGSVYAHDIVRVRVTGGTVSVEYTPAQMKLRKTVAAF